MGKDSCQRPGRVQAVHVALKQQLGIRHVPVDDIDVRYVHHRGTCILAAYVA